jgi:hypothetical protein
MGSVKNVVEDFSFVIIMLPGEKKAKIFKQFFLPMFFSVAKEREAHIIKSFDWL